jgi:hypothetical protein
MSFPDAPNADSSVMKMVTNRLSVSGSGMGSPGLFGQLLSVWQLKPPFRPQRSSIACRIWPDLSPVSVTMQSSPGSGPTGGFGRLPVE